MRLPIHSWKRTLQRLGRKANPNCRLKSYRAGFESLEQKQLLTGYFVSGAPSIELNSAYTLSLKTDSTSLNHWTVDWGDGSEVQQYTTSSSSITETHTYSTLTGSGTFQITATATDGSGDHLAYEPSDPSFGTNGTTVTTDGLGLQSGAPGPSDIIQQDDKILVAGETLDTDSGDGDFAIARYNADGSLDTSFGSGAGTVTTVNGSSSLTVPTAFSNADDSISVTGGGDDIGFTIAKYTDDGIPDTSFGTDGLVWELYAFNDQEATSTIVQPDGKILVAGTADGSDFSGLGIVRLNTDGSLDPSFGDDGTVSIDVPGAGFYGFYPHLALAANGDIIIGTSVNNTFVVGRADADGSFTDGDGFAPQAFTMDDSGYAVADAISVQSDGSITVAGTINTDLAMLRLDSGGDPDASLNGTGIALTSLSGSLTGTLNVGFGPDGSVAVAGFSGSHPHDIYMSRYNSDATLDETFGDDGLATIDLGSDIEVSGSPGAVAVQPDGKILVAGISNPDSDTPGFLVSRIIGTQYVSVDVTQPPLFYSDGVLELTASDGTDDIAVTTHTVDGVADLQVTGVTGDDISDVPAADVTTIVVVGGAGTDTIDLSGVTAAQFTSLQNVTVDAGTGDDTIDGGSGNETFVFNPYGDSLETDMLTANPAATSNTLDFSGFDSDQPVNIDLRSTSPQTVSDGVLSLTLGDLNEDGDIGIENVIGGSGDDTIYGNDRDNHIYETTGTNYLYGEGGTNAIYGGDGVDYIFGGSGTDYLYGGNGDDFLTAGSGTEYLSGGAGDNTLYGGSGTNTFIKGHGDETFWDGSGDNNYVFNWNPGDDGLGAATINGYSGTQTGTDSLDFSHFFATDYTAPDPSASSDQTVSNDQVFDDDLGDIGDLLHVTFASGFNPDVVGDNITAPGAFTSSVAGVISVPPDDTGAIQLSAYGVQGTYDSVNFYYDSNGDGIKDDGDLLLGTATDGSNGYFSMSVPYDQSQGSWTDANGDALNLSAGQPSVLAVASNDGTEGNSSGASSMQVPGGPRPVPKTPPPPGPSAAISLSSTPDNNYVSANIDAEAYGGGFFLTEDYHTPVPKKGQPQAISSSASDSGTETNDYGGSATSYAESNIKAGTGGGRSIMVTARSITSGNASTPDWRPDMKARPRANADTKDHLGNDNNLTYIVEPTNVNISTPAARAHVYTITIEGTISINWYNSSSIDDTHGLSSASSDSVISATVGGVPGGVNTTATGTDKKSNILGKQIPVKFTVNASIDNPGIFTIKINDAQSSDAEAMKSPGDPLGDTHSATALGVGVVTVTASVVKVQ